MSESYTAEQLVAFLNKWMGGILTLYIAGENAGKQGVMREKEEFKAIIARLRAADALCAVAEHVAPVLRRGGWEETSAALFKAIADYEPIIAYDDGRKK